MTTLTKALIIYGVLAGLSAGLYAWATWLIRSGRAGTPAQRDLLRANEWWVTALAGIIAAVIPVYGFIYAGSMILGYVRRMSRP